MPTCSVTVELGQPTHAPCNRIFTTPSGVMSTSSTSPPSDWTVGRMSAMTLATRSRTVGPAAELACWVLTDR